MSAWTIANEDDLAREGAWRLVRRTLGLRAFGMNRTDDPARRLTVSAPVGSGFEPQEWA